jgi:hypothetical protein
VDAQSDRLLESTSPTLKHIAIRTVTDRKKTIWEVFEAERPSSFRMPAGSTARAREGGGCTVLRDPFT